MLDEPTIGLHPRDNVTLLDTLDRLRAKGNTLVVVEHDEDTIRRADHVIDLGPGAGTRGGLEALRCTLAGRPTFTPQGATIRVADGQPVPQPSSMNSASCAVMSKRE